MNNQVEYTREQEEFIAQSIDHLNNRSGLKTCDGKGGSGKSTCLREIVKQIKDPLILCPTHIAKKELLKKIGDLSADLRIMTTTAFLKDMVTTQIEDAQSKLFFFESEGDQPAIAAMRGKVERLLESGRANDPVFRNKEDMENPDAVILDEAGMVSRGDMDELELRARAILAVGDGFQLPPVVVGGDEEYEDWFYNRHHDFNLSTVHRNAGDVLKFVNRIREFGGNTKFPLFKEITDAKMKDVILLKRSNKLFKKIGEEEMMLLAFYNEDVDRLAYDVREAMGYDPNYCEEGEPLYASSNKGGKIPINNKDEVHFNARFCLTSSSSSLSLTKVETNQVTTAMVNTARLNYKLNEKEKKRQLSNKGLQVRFDRSRTVYGAQGAQAEKVIWGGRIPKFFTPLKHNRMLYTAGSRAQHRFGAIV